MSVPECYIVTGGGGFIGSGLCAELALRRPDAEIVVVDDFRSGSYANLVDMHEYRGIGPFVGEVIPASIEEIDFTELFVAKRPSAVFHMGAITDTTVDDERAMLEVNSETFGPMLETCIEAETPLVYASSAATYGTPPQAGEHTPFPVSAAGRPNNVYGFSKWLMEALHRRLTTARPDAHVVGLRFFNVFGPGEARKGKMASMPYQLAQRMLAGDRPRLFSHGEQQRDQVWVGDVIDCCLHAAGMGGRGPGQITPGVYNLGSGRPTSFNDIVEALREGMGITEAESQIEYFEMPASVRAFYQDFTLADMSETKSGLGWSPPSDPPQRIAEYGRWLAGRAPAGATA
ncbi:MAG: NAD-dependent epimerase/dehydratase family protein [Planctomycetota bacterium]